MNHTDAFSSPLPVPVPIFGNLLVMTDPGRDQDDEDTLVLKNRLVRLDFLRVLGVVANLAPSKSRARLAKGTLNMLGQPNIPVGFGSSCKQIDNDGLSYQFNVGYLAPTEDVQDGKELILNALQAAKPKSVVLLLISGLTDAADALREHSELFTNAVRRVVIMGGVKEKMGGEDGKVGLGLPELDAEGRMIPDLTAQNHAFDKDATTFLYEQLQDLEIPMTIVSRHAAIAAKVPRSLYDNMAATGHPVGLRLQQAQMQAIEELWRRACLPADDENRAALPARCDKTWFCNTFCGGQGHDLQPTDSIWPYIETFNLYDPATLVAAIPNLRTHFFCPSVVEYKREEHLVIGVSAKMHNVRNGPELADFMCTSLVESLQLSMGTRQAKIA